MNGLISYNSPGDNMEPEGHDVCRLPGNMAEEIWDVVSKRNNFAIIAMGSQFISESLCIASNLCQQLRCNFHEEKRQFCYSLIDIKFKAVTRNAAAIKRISSPSDRYKALVKKVYYTGNTKSGLIKIIPDSLKIEKTTSSPE